VSSGTKKGIIVASGAWNHEIFGGAYKVATEFAEFLAKEGHRVFYISGSKDSFPENPTNYKGVEVWRYPVPRAKSPSLANLLGHLSRSRKLATTITSKHEIDFVNGHEPLQFLGVLQGLKGSHVKTAYSVHSPFVQEKIEDWGVRFGTNGLKKGYRLPTLKEKLSIKVLEFLECRTYQKADVIQTDSRFTLNEIIRDYGNEVKSKGFVCPLWVDLEKFPLCGDKNAVRKRLGKIWDTNAALFFSLRRLVPRMGLDNLIEAVAMLKKQGYKCRLIIGGVGSEKDALETLVKELDLEGWVFFIGRISSDELPLCYQASDCFVLPTRALECFGLVILEAYASGTTVIATPIGSIPEVMGEVGRDFLADGASPVALSKIMQRFLDKKIAVEPTNLRKRAELYAYPAQAQKLANLLLNEC